MALIAWILLQANKADNAPSIEFEQVMGMLGHHELEEPPRTTDDIADRLAFLSEMYNASEGMQHG